ncbi:MAG: hypothetical protein KJ950_01975 [Proteobacteria bacterium]|nr:hypothetical protein [Pseudomonadota bacterium]MBU1688267.1 hypothetical protein [Pseudomonadota bacterium]
MSATLSRIRFIFLTTLVILSVMVGGALATTIQVKTLAVTPVVDGNDQDWQDVPGVEVPVAGELAVRSVLVKGGVSGKEVFFLFQWDDTTEDLQHKPFIWNEAAQKYDAGPQQEDRFAINFAMSGDFTTDWISGNSFTADMWHWKTARSNPLGLAQDKMTIITTEPTKKAYETKAKNGQKIYIIRPSDEGSELYSTIRYATKEKDMMPKYIMIENPTGSVADVKAKGVWKDGRWTLEVKRLLNTGNKDDAVFELGKAIQGGIAVFDRSGDEHHNISSTLIFQF